MVEMEMGAFLQKAQQKRVLLFPPLSHRLRFLIHKTAENYSSLSTFSVGEGSDRRVVLCHADLRLPEAAKNQCASHNPPQRAEGTSSAPVTNNCPTRIRAPRRSDQAIYIPRAMRERASQATAQPNTGQSAPTIHELVSQDSSNHESASHKQASQEPANHESSYNPNHDHSLLEIPVKFSCQCSQTVSCFASLSLEDAEKESDVSKLCYSKDFTREIIANLKEGDVVIEDVLGDYSYESMWVSSEEFAHVIEIYNFPAKLKTEDLQEAFADFSDGGLKIKWVDDTRALGVFSSKLAAQQALTIQHPLLKVRMLSDASKKSKLKALRFAEFVQPVRERPRTDTTVARRMVTRALGLQKCNTRGKP